jgi:predicted nucleotidyltransferase
MKVADLNLPITLDELRRILREHGVVKASVFGSYARGEARPDSDLDILVSYGDGVSLFTHFDLRDELEKYGGKPVDIISDRALSRHFRPYVEKDKVTIL